MNDRTFVDHLDVFSDRICCVDERSVPRSYGELIEAGDAVAAALGPRRGVVFIEGRNTFAMLASYVGCLRARHVVHLVDPERRAETETLREVFRPLAVVGTAHEPQVTLTPDAFGGCHPELALLLPTSGSTGAKKLVKISRTGLHSNAESIASYLCMEASDRAITLLKPHYSYGLSVINSHLLVGASLALVDCSVQDEEFWNVMETSGVTNISGVPYTYEMLAQMLPRLEHATRLRFLTQAGGRLAPELVRLFAAESRKSGRRFFVMYGQTEASPRMSFVPPALVERYPDAIGIAIPGGRLSVVRDDGRQAADDEEGELVYEGPNVMMGYAWTASELAVDETPPHLKTGDLASRNSEGIFRITGRRARFVKPFGVRVSLDELERHLGERGVVASVVGTDDRILVCPRHATSEAETIRSLASVTGLPPALFDLVVVAEPPLLSSGKVDLVALGRLLKQRPAAKPDGFFSLWAKEVRVLLGLQARTSVLEIFRTHFPAETLEGHETFVSLGGDSLLFVQMVSALNDYLLEVPTNWQKRSIRELEALAGS